MPGQKSTKKRTKLEKILRQDHSDVYFDNDRLSDELARRIELMQQEQHKRDITRGIEIGKLRREIGQFKAQAAELDVHEKRLRAQSAQDRKVYNKEERRLIKRSQSAWGRTTSNPDETDGDNKETPAVPEDDTEQDGEPDIPERSDTPSSVFSTLRDTSTLKRYQRIGGNSFKHNNRFPKEWYVRHIPPSDAAIHQAGRKVRGKSAPPYFNFLAKLRDKEETEKNLLRFKQTKLLLPTNDAMATEDNCPRKMILICDEPVRPLKLQRNHFRELSKLQNVADHIPKSKPQTNQKIINLSIEQGERVGEKVRAFCEALKEQKIRDAKLMKEREETRRREAQERLYLESIDIAQIVKLDEPQDDSDDEDERWRQKWAHLKD